MNQWRRKRDRGDDSEQTNDQGYSSLDRIAEQSSEDDSTLPAGEDDITSPSSVNPTSAPASEDHTDDQPITESTSETTAESSSEKYLSENANLQFGKGHASRGLSPYEDMKIGNSPKPSVGGFELNRIYHLLITPDSEAYQAFARHLEGSVPLLDLAGEVCLTLTGSREQTDSYVEPVRCMVDELAMDDGISR